MAAASAAMASGSEAVTETAAVTAETVTAGTATAGSSAYPEVAPASTEGVREQGPSCGGSEAPATVTTTAVATAVESAANGTVTDGAGAEVCGSPGDLDGEAVRGEAVGSGPGPEEGYPSEEAFVSEGGIPAEAPVSAEVVEAEGEGEVVMEGSAGASGEQEHPYTLESNRENADDVNSSGRSESMTSQGNRGWMSGIMSTMAFGENGADEVPPGTLLEIAGREDVCSGFSRPPPSPNPRLVG